MRAGVVLAKLVKRRYDWSMDSIRNNDENEFLGSSGIALLFSLMLSDNTFDFIITWSLNLCFIIDLVLSCQTMSNFKDVQRPQLVFITSIQVAAQTK